MPTWLGGNAGTSRSARDWPSFSKQALTAHAKGIAVFGGDAADLLTKRHEGGVTLACIPMQNDSLSGIESVNQCPIWPEVCNPR